MQVDWSSSIQRVMLSKPPNLRVFYPENAPGFCKVVFKRKKKYFVPLHILLNTYEHETIRMA